MVPLFDCRQIALRSSGGWTGIAVPYCRARATSEQSDTAFGQSRVVEEEWVRPEKHTRRNVRATR